jgi:hypothetical protein
VNYCDCVCVGEFVCSVVVCEILCQCKWLCV